MLRLPSPLPLIAAAIVVATPLGCGRAHDLGADTTTTASATGGAGSSSSSSSSSSGGAGGASSSSSSSGSGGTGGIDTGPTGPTELTIVNGINDYPAIRLCFQPSETPWPTSIDGLAFAASAVVDPISTTIPTNVDVTPWAIAGELGLTAGKTCAQIFAMAAADPTKLVAAPLALVPKSVWESKKSLLLVPNGCLGGPTHDDPAAKGACGMGYSAATPTATIAIVSMSRVEDPAHVSLQIASASPAIGEIDVGLTPNLTSATPQGVVYALTQGAIGPNPPFAKLTAAELGPLDGVQIITYTPNSAAMTSTTLLGSVLANGGVSQDAIVNGARLVLVAVGAGPGVPAASFWHALTYTLVKADPGP